MKLTGAAWLFLSLASLSPTLPVPCVTGCSFLGSVCRQCSHHVCSCSNIRLWYSWAFLPPSISSFTATVAALSHLREDASWRRAPFSGMLHTIPAVGGFCQRMVFTPGSPYCIKSTSIYHFLSESEELDHHIFTSYIWNLHVNYISVIKKLLWSK